VDLVPPVGVGLRRGRLGRDRLGRDRLGSRRLRWARRSDGGHGLLFHGRGLLRSPAVRPIHDVLQGAPVALKFRMVLENNKE